MAALPMVSDVETGPLPALNIPKMTHSEAVALAVVELERVIALVESLEDEDWTQPTDCTEWNVREMVAHLAGALAASASFAEFKRQMMQNPYMKEMPQQIDAINRVQVEDRAERTPEQLLAELRDVGPKGLRTRARLPWLVRNIRLPLGVLGLAPIGYLTDTIYTRDQWIHRVDISRATGKPMPMTESHDGRIVALVIYDLARKLKGKLDGKTIDLHLTGALELAYRFGSGSSPDATVTLDLIEFNRLASERITPEAALEHTAIMGNTETGKWFIHNCQVAY